MSVEQKHVLPALQAFVEVATDSIQLGMLMDKSLYVFLESNNKYVRIVKQLHPVDERIMEIIKKSKILFTKDHSIESLYPELPVISENLKNLCISNDFPSFEKHRRIQLLLQTMIIKCFKNNSGPEWDPTKVNSELQIQDANLCVFLINRAFGLPKPESLMFLENISVGIYEISIVRAAISGIFALLLGYNDYNFIYQYVHSVFYEEIKLMQANYAELPGFDPRNKRLGFIIQDDILPHATGSFSDESVDIIHFVRWLYSNTFKISSQKALLEESLLMTGDVTPKSRVYQKLKSILDKHFNGFEDKKLEIAA